MATAAITKIVIKTKAKARVKARGGKREKEGN